MAALKLSDIRPAPYNRRKPATTSPSAANATRMNVTTMIAVMTQLRDIAYLD